MTRRLFFFILSFIFMRVVLSQSSCTQNLNEAENAYKEGRLKDIETLINPCLLQHRFLKAESIRAYKLLTLLHLYNDEYDKAETSFLNLIHTQHEYPIDYENDPTVFIDFYKKYRTKPIFRISFNVGLTNTRPDIIETFGTYDTSEPDRNSLYSSSLGPQFGVGIEYNLFWNVDVVGEVNLANRILKIEEQSDFIGGYTLNTTEEQRWLEFPLYLRVGRSIKNYIPYAYFGASFNYLTRSVVADGSRDQVKKTDIDLIQNDLRDRINGSFVAGIGVKLKTQNNFVKLDLRYSQGRSNVVDQSGRYNNRELVFELGHVDNNFRQNFFSLTVGYVLSVYKPVKKKQYR